MNGKVLLLIGILGIIVVGLEMNKERGYTATDAARATPEQNVYSTPKPVPTDSDAVKAREAQYFANHTYASATVDDYNDHALTVRIDGNLWDAWGSQDRELHKRGYYNAWVAAYAANHPKKWTHYAPFSVRIVDLTGTQLAVEE